MSTINLQTIREAVKLDDGRAVKLDELLSLLAVFDDANEAAFDAEFIAKAARLRLDDQGGYERLTAAVRERGVRLRQWEPTVKAVAKQIRDREQPDKPALPEAPDDLLERGDHVELAGRMLAALGPEDHLVYDDGNIYGYEPSSGIWDPVSAAEMSRTIQRFAGLPVGEPDKRGRYKELSIRANDVTGSIKLARDRVAHPGFFSAAEPGIAFADCFVVVTAEGAQRQPHQRSNRARFAYGFNFQETPQPGRFLTSLYELFRDDADREEKIACLQEFLGASLLGIATRYQQAVVLLGEGSNGKGMLSKVIAAAMPPGSTCSITPQQFGGEYYRAKLAGRRLNIVNELPKNDIIDAEACKAIIAGDPITARQIRQEPFEMIPQAGHLFSANGLPGTKDQSHGFWRRWRVISFNRIFTAEDKDPQLAEHIIAHELPDVVAWMLQGAVQVQRQNGYTEPASSVEALSEWRHGADQVAEFVADRCRPGSNEFERTAASQLYRTYRSWADEVGHRALSMKKFCSRLQGLGFKREKTRQGMFYPLSFAV